MAWPADSPPRNSTFLNQLASLPSLTLASTLSSFLPQMTEHGTAIWATAFPGCCFVLVILELIDDGRIVSGDGCGTGG
ncbi:uncharacterized protein K441DRAFT_98879 [Cenococcum geophilum 1.58]|uniref:uncharacterized protein n=1 Tax=Cenococcum geophilum 1.58 TaxID=794803 RepID=UPI00358F1099|nr:hypothetical protein K441DRAFT_98879 [Cenococcum geophilum 1.58]